MSSTVLNLCAALAFMASPLLAHAAAPPAKDIVVKVERDGNTFTVNAEFTVAANADDTWEVLTDFDKMASILSNVDASKITNRDGNKFEVVQKSHTQAGLVKLSLDSVRQVELTPKKEIRSHLVKGDLKSSDFSTRLAEEGGVTKVTVSGKFVTAGLASAAVTAEGAQAQTQRQYQELREEILRRKAKEPTPPCILAKNCTTQG
jgi:carbon monoxide dehydrogenase subunit G